MYVAGGVVAFFFIVSVMPTIRPSLNDHPPGQMDEKQKARFVIEQCWKDQERKSLDDSTKRFVARMCENFEADFRAKYKQNP